LVGPDRGEVRAGPGPLCSEAGVRARLRGAGLRPARRRGQNFLCSQAVLRDTLAAAELRPTDAVLEIGAGLGTLTAAMAPLVCSVTAIEVDRGLCRLLREETAGFPNVTVACGDVTAMDPRELLPGAPAAGGPCASPRPFKVITNLPYYLTTPLLQRMLGEWQGMSMAVVMLQEEVARRLAAGPGEADYGSLSVFAGYHAECRIVRTVPSSAFWPRPGVSSALVRIVRRPRPPVEADPDVLFAVVRSAFGLRRKQIRNALAGPPLELAKQAAEEALSAAGISGTRRGETMSLAEFAALARFLSKNGARRATAPRDRGDSPP